MIDPEQLSRLFDRHAAALELYVRQWTPEAADIVQAAYVRLAEQKTVPRDPVAWLYRVARNLAVSQARSAAARRRREQAVGHDTNRWFAQPTSPDVDIDEVIVALQQLPQDQREVVVLRIWGGRTYDEIADITGSPRTTVYRKYQSALRELRDMLESPCSTNPTNSEPT